MAGGFIRHLTAFVAIELDVWSHNAWVLVHRCHLLVRLNKKIVTVIQFLIEPCILILV
jgi:hypothetical protein